MERLVLSRLQYHLESRNLLNPCQAGFRKGHSTSDQLIRVSQHIFDGLEHSPPHRAALVLLDFSKAYDRVWQAGLIHKLLELSVPACATRWIRSFLSDRRGRVNWQGSTSRWRLFKEGLPQGSVLAPTLWLCYVNDIPTSLDNKDLVCSLFADDVALAATARTFAACQSLLQPVLDDVSAWADRWKVQLNPPKCSYTTFTLDPSQSKGKVSVRLKVAGQDVSYTDNPTFLGLTFDSHLTFHEHCRRLKSTMASRIHCLQNISGKTYGCDFATLRTAYIGYVRSCADYGAAIWSTFAAPSTIQAIETEQRRAARVITGCTNLTNVDILLAEARLTPIHTRGLELAAREFQRAIRLPTDDPLHQIAVAPSGQPRLKSRAYEAVRRNDNVSDLPHALLLPRHRQSWRRAGHQLSQIAGLEHIQAEPMLTHQPTPPWSIDTSANVNIATDLCRRTRRADPPALRRQAALDTLDALPPACVEVWTDGSVTGGFGAGGGGLIINHIADGTSIRRDIPTGQFCSSYIAELRTIEAALAYIRDSACPGRIRLLTDSQSALVRLSQGPQKQACVTSCKIWEHLSAISSDHSIDLQWIPGHAGLDGNEEVDALANAGRQLAQHDISIDRRSAAAAIRNSARALICPNNDKFTSYTHLPHTDTSGLTRAEQVAVCQLRAGYSPRTRDFLFRIGKAEDDLCPGCGDHDNITHLLLHCPAYNSARAAQWGFTPTLEQAFNSGRQLINFLHRAGRLESPVEEGPRPSRA
jgi:ribonuclease HI